MTLLSMYKRDDSRTVYRILADEAVKCLDHPEAGTKSKIIFTNLARLLERYRYDAFSYDAAPGILEVFPIEGEDQRADLTGAHQKTSSDVIVALEAAHTHVYHSLSREDLVENLKRLLAQLAASKVPDDQDTKARLAQARLFFEALAEGLRKRSA
jgi:hypothetical protein